MCEPCQIYNQPYGWLYTGCQQKGDRLLCVFCGSNLTQLQQEERIAPIAAKERSRGQNPNDPSIQKSVANLIQIQVKHPHPITSQETVKLQLLDSVDKFPLVEFWD